MAASTAGWRCPTLATLMPPITSRYFFPAASHMVQPSAFTMSSANGAADVCATCCKKRERVFMLGKGNCNGYRIVGCLRNAIALFFSVKRCFFLVEKRQYGLLKKFID